MAPGGKIAVESGAASEERDDNRLDRAELMKLYEQYAVEIRACLDFAHRYLAFYVGLLSAMLVAVVAGLLQADAGDFRVFGLLIGPLLMVVVAEVGYLMVRVFYHRFMDASLTLLNISRMLRLDDLRWVSDGLAPPLVVSRYGGFAAQWVGAREWLKLHQDLDLEAAKQAILGQQVSRPIGLLRGRRPSLSRLPTVTLTAARRTMWAFEASGLLLVPVIIASGV